MHVALANNKTSLNSARDMEDKLTSMFFGTLQYLPSSAIACFISSLLNPFKEDNKPISDFLDFIDVKKHYDIEFEFDFWPNLSKNKGGRIEPDLVIKTKNALNEMKLLIECKWESKESSQEQLIKQWEACQDSDKNNLIHIYLVKDRENASQFCETSLSKRIDINWQDRLHLITWYDVINTLNNRLSTKIESDLEKDNFRIYSLWKKHLTQMFNRIGIYAFNGFKDLHSIDIPVLTTDILFWTLPLDL